MKWYSTNIFQAADRGRAGDEQADGIGRRDRPTAQRTGIRAVGMAAMLSARVASHSRMWSAPSVCVELRSVCGGVALWRTVPSRKLLQGMHISLKLLQVVLLLKGEIRPEQVTARKQTCSGGSKVQVSEWRRRKQHTKLAVQQSEKWDAPQCRYKITLIAFTKMANQHETGRPQLFLLEMAMLGSRCIRCIPEAYCGVTCPEPLLFPHSHETYHHCSFPRPMANQCAESTNRIAYPFFVEHCHEIPWDVLDGDSLPKYCAVQKEY